MIKSELCNVHSLFSLRLKKREKKGRRVYNLKNFLLYDPEGFETPHLALHIAQRKSTPCRACVHILSDRHHAPWTHTHVHYTREHTRIHTHTTGSRLLIVLAVVIIGLLSFPSVAKRFNIRIMLCELGVWVVARRRRTGLCSGRS